MESNELSMCLKHAAQFSELTGVSVTSVSIKEKETVYPQSGCPGCFCDKCRSPRCVMLHTHMYGLNEATRWGGKYIYYCPLGLVFVASVLPYETSFPAYGMVAGPIIMGDSADTLAELSGIVPEEALTSLPVFSTTKVNCLASILSATCCDAANLPRNSKMQKLVYYDKDLFLSELYSAQEALHDAHMYPIRYEKELLTMICAQDKSGAQSLLNELLGMIFVSNNYEVSSIKPRIIELVVLLSRAKIDAGADAQDVLIDNTNYIKQINRMDDIEDISEWLSGVLNRFIGYTFVYANIKHSNIVHKAMEFIKANYNRKITLDDVARHVYLSRSYLSSVFKKKTGYSISAYINHIRVEKSKTLLLSDQIKIVEIAGLCGFEDQSYFTKVFKKEVGMSPRKFCDINDKS